MVTAEGDSVQSRQLIHATGESVAFDVPITQQAQPNLVVTAVIVHDRPVDDGAKEPQGSAGGAHADHHGHAQQARTICPGEKGSFDVLAVDSQGKPVQADLSFGEVDEALYSVRPDYERRHRGLLLSQALRLSRSADLVRLLLLRRGGNEESAAGAD